MADTHHEETDPNVAPIRYSVREDFSIGAYAFAFGLGAIAIIAGLILGLTLIVD